MYLYTHVIFRYFVLWKVPDLGKYVSGGSIFLGIWVLQKVSNLNSFVLCQVPKKVPKRYLVPLKTYIDWKFYNLKPIWTINLAQSIVQKAESDSLAEPCLFLLRCQNFHL